MVFQIKEEARMKRGIIWLLLSCILVISLVLASCGSSATTTASTQATTTHTTSVPVSTSASTTKPASTTTAVTAVTTTTSATGHWWDSLGTPQYGGTLTFRISTNIVEFDPLIVTGMGIQVAYMERLVSDDWAIDPAIFDYKIGFRPADYVKGYLAESIETPDASTYIAHLRQNIYWQNIAPANGRQFVASDVVFHFNRYLGLGGGYTAPIPTANINLFKSLVSVTTTDKYTVVFKWKVASLESMFENMGSMSPSTSMENPEAVAQWGNLNDWHHAVGTGPFILSDFVDSSSATVVKNPNYWGYDEHYPQNKLPYVNSIKVIIIPNAATALAAVRSGKIDAINSITFQDAQSMLKTNPEIIQIKTPGSAPTIDPRVDTKPFTDVKVRQAMQMAFDLPTLAKSYYQGSADPYPSSLTSRAMKGWGYIYEDWPQDLKDQYAYNVAGAKKLLADAGYASGIHTNIVFDNSGDLDLLQIEQSSLATIGIIMDIRLMDPPAWVAFVNANQQDQISQRSSPSLGFSFEPLIQLQHFMTGFKNSSMATGFTDFDQFYPAALVATSIDQVKQIVKAANEYVARQHFCVSLFQIYTYCLSQPWLKGFNGQNHSLYGGSNGPLLLCYYGARFWIDQSQKTALGH
jgi:peptide/nickel transport system substrate-binding protein